MPALSRQTVASTARSEAEPWTVGLISQPFETLSSEARCADVFEWFMRRPQVPAAAIVDQTGAIQGLVNWLRFLAHYAQRYIPELYGPRPITALANRTPLIVDEHLAVTALGERLTETPDALHECFVITRADAYLGIGTGDALVRAKVRLLVRQEGELRSAMERALEASKTKSNFLALMSHELRTPLNAIIGFSEVLKTELFGPIGSQKYLDYARHVHDAGTHLLQLINDILDLSKAESGKMELAREAVDIPGLVNECMRLVEGRAAEGGLRLVTDIPPLLPALDGDPLRLKQILLNLLSNAIKFTPKGRRCHRARRA
jgi:two-component system cell cycle sensor histidine kinase PleC